MKHIKLNRIIHINKGFRIYLGNGYIFEFTSLRSARAFLSITNSFLTDNLSEVNSWYKLTYSRYRDNWLLFYHNKKSLRQSSFADNYRIESLMRSVADLLDYAFNSATTENGSTWEFTDLIKCLDCLEESLLLLLKYSKKRSETASIYEIRNTIKRLTDLRNGLTSYGNLQAAGRHARVIEMANKIEMIPTIERKIISS